MQGGKVKGAILFGNTAEGTALLALVQRGADAAELAPGKERLIRLRWLQLRFRVTKQCVPATM